MKNLDQELATRLKDLEFAEGMLMKASEPTDEVISSINKIVEQAAWIHHAITQIHPFRDGNGRTARLAANLVLERYGLVGISIKIERENKNRYRQALVQIDSMNDYQPLIEIISEGLIERYNGVDLKYYDEK